ncbi:hypothetical protein M8818_001451 [Zalaria obscura]|uniref:Uncharacterized protein n=1 Tax=Zalaria obscura TaxID=2024903 RepID=A0ACC3SKW9_9PEZI
MRLTTLAPFLALALALGLPLTLAAPTSPSASPLPLIIWHGLGDRYDADGLSQVAELAAQVHPGSYVYPIRISEDGSDDQKATFFGNLTTQINTVCTTLSTDPLLNSNHTRIDALGFSQGGQFLRGLIETCPSIRVRSLVTFGSQHNGIAKFQTCGTWDLLCKGAVGLVRGNAWTAWVQGNIVPAQYYREINETTGEGSETYLDSSGWLADVNNERDVKNAKYKERLGALERFVMYIFSEDKTVIPKESGWFAEVNATDGTVTQVRNRTMYAEDWIGLRRLDEKGALVFREAPGEHMRLDEDLLRETFAAYFGPERESWDGTETETTSGGEDQVVLGLYEL